jgi:hypothetical protein
MRVVVVRIVVASFSYQSYDRTVRTTKISIAIDKQQLRRARAAAKTEGLSLSAYIARALASKLEDQGRVNAGRELHASWGPDTVPTDKDRAEFLARMARPRQRRARAA